jgi:hypothetical protein
MQRHLWISLLGQPSVKAVLYNCSWSGMKGMCHCYCGCVCCHVPANISGRHGHAADERLVGAILIHTYQGQQNLLLLCLCVSRMCCRRWHSGDEI